MVMLFQALPGTTLLVQRVVSTNMLAARRIGSHMESFPLPILFDIYFVFPLKGGKFHSSIYFFVSSLAHSTPSSFQHINLTIWKEKSHITRLRENGKQVLSTLLHFKQLRHRCDAVLVVIARWTLSTDINISDRTTDQHVLPCFHFDCSHRAHVLLSQHSKPSTPSRYHPVLGV